MIESEEMQTIVVGERCCTVPKDAANELRRLRAAVEYALRVAAAWTQDANPHGDLQPGESAEYDAAQLFFTAMDQALRYREPAPPQFPHLKPTETPLAKIE